ncbi:MAG TPA: helix-hairpin-helix domain-containing protein [Pirellulaceae bacterium]|nr:helix-hairpin-helix domain-containing protein [Pirellulaceae bacterium]
MPTDPEPSRSAWPRLWLRRADQAVAAVFIAVALAAIGGYTLWQGSIRSRLIEIDRAEPIAIETKIDINRADWPELCLMPGVGEVLAQRIVADREENGPFLELDDLRRVRGIGPLTLEGMKPYLLPMPELDATAEGNSGGRGAKLVN